jgi:hypothetical protein
MTSAWVGLPVLAPDNAVQPTGASVLRLLAVRASLPLLGGG